MGYESIIWVEDIPIYDKDTLQCPDALFMLFHEIIAFDHLQNQIILFSNVQIKDGSGNSATPLSGAEVDVASDNTKS